MKKKTFFVVFTLSILLTGCVSPSQEPEPAKKGLYIAQMPTKTTFYQYEEFTSEGISVIDKTSGKPMYDYTMSLKEGDILENAGVIPVNITMDDYTPTSYSINVIEVDLNKALEITTFPKTVFEYGNYFTTSGLVVEFNDEVITDFTIECEFREGDSLTTPGTYDVTIRKDGYVPATYSFVVKHENSLSISSLPNDRDYKTGEAFSSSGLVVVDQDNQIVTEYDLSIEEGSILKYEGTITVKISKKGFDDISFTINVTKAEEIKEKSRDLKIYYVNDTHGSFIRQKDENPPEAGMSYISSYLKSETSDNREDCLILSGGDMFQGGLESNETRGDIMVDAMNEIGFDAMVVGNHEFDWGEEHLRKFATNLDCGLISSNIFYSSKKTRPDYIEPYKIIDRDDLRIGIIGAARKDMGSSITGSISRAFSFPDPVSYVKQYSDELRMSHGCDVIITLFHDEGFEGYEGSPTKFQELTTISSVSKAKYTDAMFFSHDHLRKSGTYNGVPYLEAGCNGNAIGEMSFSLKGTTTYSVNSFSYEVKYAHSLTSSYGNDDAIDALLDKYSDRIGNPDEVIYTFSKSYSSDAFTDVAVNAMYWYVNSNPSIFDNTHVYVASHNTGGIRASVSRGKFTRRNLIKVFPFDNELCIQTCTSTNINNLLNHVYYYTYKENEVIFDENGYTKAVSITYITESSYGSRFQKSFKKYEPTAKDALIAYLKSAEGIAKKW